MATSAIVKTESFLAGAAFAAADFGKLVEASAANTVDIVDAVTDVPIGVIAEVPVAIGQEVPIALIGAGGRMKVQSGGTVTVGQLLVPAADGQVTGVAGLGALAVDQTAVGIAISAGGDGEIIEMIAGYIAAPHTA